MHRKPTEVVNGNGHVNLNPATYPPPAHREKRNMAAKMQQMSQMVPGEGGQAIAQAAMLIFGMTQMMDMLMEDVRDRRRSAIANGDELSNTGYAYDEGHASAEFELFD